MEKFLINGSQKLNGELKIHGAKNSVLPILAATIIVSGVSEIHNCPNLSDVNSAIKILRYLGCRVKYEENVITVDSSTIDKFDIPENLMREMRSSIIFLGSIVSKMGKAQMYAPGGCEIGLRPIDLHLDSLRKLKATINEDNGLIECNVQSKLTGTKIVLPFPSVGATENIIIASTLAQGKTTITNAAREPEIQDLVDFLNGAGASIECCGNGIIIVNGVSKLNPSYHFVISDRIAAATYMAAGIVTNSNIKLKGIKPSHIESVISVFDDMGANIKSESNGIRIVNNKRLKRIKEIKTMPYPGFPTDCQAQIMALLATAKGTSTVVENIFESRYKHVPELKRFGAKITVNDKVAVVEGVREFKPASVKATDLRGGAALVIASLYANGVSEISDIYHIDRGYEKMEIALSSLGANIKRIVV